VCGQIRAPAAIPPGKEPPPPTHWIGGWVDPRDGLNDAEKRKFLTPPGLELRPLGRSARSQSLYRLRYPGTYNTVDIRKNDGYCITEEGNVRKEYVIYSTHCFNKEMLCSGNYVNHVSAFTLVSCSACSILKRWLTFNGLYAVMSQKVIFILHNYGCKNIRSCITYLSTIFLNL
jgi:hypothetical protein